jgi:hypothetical protein
MTRLHIDDKNTLLTNIIITIIIITTPPTPPPPPDITMLHHWLADGFALQNKDIHDTAAAAAAGGVRKGGALASLQSEGAVAGVSVLC